MTSITSGSGCVQISDAVKQAVLAVSKHPSAIPGSAKSGAPRSAKYCVLKFVGTAKVDVETILDDGCTWEEFVAGLPQDECRFAVADFDFVAQSDGVRRSRLVFLQWAPLHTTSVRDRMLTSMFSKGVETRLEALGIGMPIRMQAGSAGELQHQWVEDKVRAKCTVK